MELVGCVYNPGQVGMFVWARIPESYQNGYELSDDILHGTHVFLTPGGIFGSQGDRYIRVSLCSPIDVFETAILRIQTHLANKTQQHPPAFHHQPALQP